MWWRRSFCSLRENVGSWLPDPATRAIAVKAAASLKNTPLKVICSRRFTMSGEEAGNSWPAVGMIWTMSTSDASDAPQRDQRWVGMLVHGYANPLIMLMLAKLM